MQVSETRIKVDVEYPKSIIKPFEFKDLDDFETSILDILNLVITEGWQYQMGYDYNHQLIFTKDKVTLLLEYRKEENRTSNEFKISFSNLDLGEGYDQKHKWVLDKVISFRAHLIEKTHPKLMKDLNKFIHHYDYQDMVKERESSKKSIMEKKSKLDEILASIHRDRRIDEILN
jgi:hypothetical protein